MSIPVQSPPFWAVPVSSHLHKGRGGLDDRLILSQSLELVCEHGDQVLRHLARLDQVTRRVDRHLQDRLGCRVQRACSFGLLDRTPSALAHQLPRVAGCVIGPEDSSDVDPGQAPVGPEGQHSDSGVYKSPGRDTLSSHVTTRPPSPPLESAMTEITACHFIFRATSFSQLMRYRNRSHNV